MTLVRRVLIVFTMGWVSCGATAWAAVDTVDMTLREKTITLNIYRPAVPDAQVQGVVFMASGDVGWVGLAVSLSEYLRDNGYLVVGINSRQYLAAFTSGKRHVMPGEVPGDYAAFAHNQRVPPLPVIVSGVSEGAALAVLAASSAANHSWISGVITMGLPTTAELAWRWSDFTSWITKKDASEPSFAAADVIAGVSPLPLCLIQSTKDEYVTEQDYHALEAAAREPKKLVLIAASNHRFTDKLPDLRREYLAAIAWIRGRSNLTTRP